MGAVGGHGCSEEFMDVCGYLWVFMGVYRCLRESMGVHSFAGICGFLWVFMGFWVSFAVYGCDGFRPVSMGVRVGQNFNYKLPRIIVIKHNLITITSSNCNVIRFN